MALLITTTIGSVLSNLGSANPYFREYVGPDAYTRPPNVSVRAPLNNISYPDTQTPLNIKVSLPESTTATGTYVLAVYYEGDWLQNRTYLYQSKGFEDEIASFQVSPEKHYFQYSGDLSGIPVGNHSIVVHAEGGGAYPPQGMTLQIFPIEGSSSVAFTVYDQSPPVISLFSVSHKTYDKPDISLNFTINEAVKQIEYCLDGKENVSITGNTTLTRLANGDHFLTLFAEDASGNVGASETISFSVNVPFPIALVTVSSVVTLIALTAVLLVYFKKHHTKSEG